MKFILKAIISSRKEEKSVDIGAIDKRKEILQDPDDEKQTYNEAQWTTESASRPFEEAFLKRCSRSILKAKVASLIENANQRSAKKNTSFYQARETIVRGTTSWGATNGANNMKIKGLTESEDAVQALIFSLIRDFSSTVPFNRLVKQQGQPAISDEKGIYDKSIAHSDHEEQATLPLPLVEMLPDSLQTKSKENKN